MGGHYLSKDCTGWTFLQVHRQIEVWSWGSHQSLWAGRRVHQNEHKNWLKMITVLPDLIFLLLSQAVLARCGTSSPATSETPILEWSWEEIWARELRERKQPVLVSQEGLRMRKGGNKRILPPHRCHVVTDGSVFSTLCPIPAAPSEGRIPVDRCGWSLLQLSQYNSG